MKSTIMVHNGGRPRKMSIDSWGIKKLWLIKLLNLLKISLKDNTAFKIPVANIGDVLHVLKFQTWKT